ncbi:MAG: hypothetical protein ABI947_09645 [Chloroflexota bacterium]
MSQNRLDDPSDKDVQMPSVRQREYRQEWDEQGRSSAIPLQRLWGIPCGGAKTNAMAQDST